MPRSKRLLPACGPLHIMCRGNNRQDIFKKQEDKKKYYFLLLELKEENKIKILHYCLMDNHVNPCWEISVVTEQTKIPFLSIRDIKNIKTDGTFSRIRSTSAKSCAFVF